MRAERDWLDSLARRATFPRAPVALRVESPAGERMSRADAVRLGLGGAAALMFGLWRIPEASALDKAQCIVQCYERHGEAHEAATQTCLRLYPITDKGAPRSWERYREIIRDFPWGWLKWTTQAGLQADCLSRANQQYREALDKCDEACEEACKTKESRTTQGRSRGLKVCKATPPPSFTPPATPPAPNSTEDPCWACVDQGGECCRGFAARATGSAGICACATPGIPCSAYGCS